MTVTEAHSHVPVDIFDTHRNDFDWHDPWAAEGLVQRYCVGHDTIMGVEVRTHDTCDDVRLLTHYQALRLLFDEPGMLGGSA